MSYNAGMLTKVLVPSVVLALLVAGAPLTANEPDSAPAITGGAMSHAETIEAYRAGRVERLRSDSGWLTICGFSWLKEGDNSVGTAERSDIRLSEGMAPPALGTLRLELEPSPRVTLQTFPDVSVQIEDIYATGSAVIWEEGGEAKKVSSDRGSFWVISRNDAYAVRMQDPECHLRTGFTEIDFYEIDPEYRVIGTLIHAPDSVDVPNIMGYTSRTWVPGPVRFTLKGEEYELFPLVGAPGDSVFQFVVQDETSGIETYGGGRYIYCDLEPDGTVVIDLNKLYNPPCVFNPYATCPLPAERDILPIAIRVGEKMYQEQAE
jgi:uncharacterized protein (DUF1684 family)